VKHLSDSQVVVVGLGLMGGSLAGALRGKCQRVTGVGRRQDTVRQAMSYGLVDRGTTDLPNVLGSTDILVLATPVRATIDLIREFGDRLADDCLVMDLGSTKTQVVAAMKELPDGVQPIGGHPMCGKEVAGIDAADPDIYRGCTFVLTPLARTSQAARTLSEDLVTAVGAHSLVLAPDRHDQLVAIISHLPYLLACALVGTAQEVSSTDPAVWNLAASGFRSASRLAASDVTMMLDILATNREQISSAVRAFEDQFQILTQLVLADNDASVRAALEAIRGQRADAFRASSPPNSHSTREQQ